MADISQSKHIVSVAAAAGFNLGADKLNIKDIRADATGFIEIIDNEGVTHGINALQAEKLTVQGKIQVTTNTVIKVQVYL